MPGCSLHVDQLFSGMVSVCYKVKLLEEGRGLHISMGTRINI